MPTRVVYVTMKPQLRGRIRRNVVTLLELGADVTVLTVASNKDFFVGLEHPRLRAEYLPARSLYVRFGEHTSRRAQEQADRRRARYAEPKRSGSNSAPNKLLYPLIGFLWMVARGWLGLSRRLLRMSNGVDRGMRRLGARLPAPVRRARWALARRRIRAGRKRSRRRLRRARLRAARAHIRHRSHRSSLRRHPRARMARGYEVGSPFSVSAPRAWKRRFNRRRVFAWRAVIRQHRILRRAILNRWLETRRLAIRQGKDVLRPWHRVTRFFAFWRDSAHRAVDLRPALVFSSDLPGLVGAGRAAHSLGIPHLHDCHELYLESTSFRKAEQRILAPMERRYMRSADAVVAVNVSIADEYGRRYGRRPVVVRNCAYRVAEELVALDLRPLAGLDSKARVVLYQGGFSGGRGLEVCVEAVAALPQDVHLVLLGYGPLRESLLEWAHDAGVGDRVHVVDAVPPDELIQWTASADIGLMPYQPVSRNNLYALPNKVFEYTTVGLPIVVSDLPELRSIALGAGCGAVYDSFDPASLSDALLQVLDDLPRYRAASRGYGHVNVWENERLILIDEMTRVAPILTRVEDPATLTEAVMT